MPEHRFPDSHRPRHRLARSAGVTVLRAMALSAAVVCVEVDAGALMELRFESVYGETQTLEREEPRWINPAGHLRLRVGAELDAVVTATISTLDDRVVVQESSRRLGSHNWILFEGVWTIGTIVHLPVPRTDGEYRLRVETTDASGVVIDSTLQSLKIDRSAPQMAGAWRYRGDLMLVGDQVNSAQEGEALPDGSVLAWSGDGEISVTGLRDMTSGVASVRFFTRHDGAPEHGDRTTELEAHYDPVTGTASISRLLQAAGAQASDDLANVDGIGFALVDAAGNRAEFVRSVRLVTGCAVRGVEVDIQTAADAAWRPADLDAPVVAGATRARVRVPRSVSALEDPLRGLAGSAPNAPGSVRWPPEPTSRDDRFDAYEIMLDAGPQTLRELVRSATHTRCGTPPPVGIVGLTLNLDGGERKTWTRHDADLEAAVLLVSGEERITGATVSVLPSEEEQLVRFGEAQCTVPARESQCSVDLLLEPSAHGSERRLSALVRASAHTRSQADLEVILLTDRIKPDIVGHGFSRDGLTLLLEIAEAATGGFAGASGLSETWVDAEGEDGSINRLEGTWSRGVGEAFRGSVALSELAQGRYRLTAYTRDTSGNLARPRVIAAFVRDRTPPLVALRHGTEALEGESVASLGAVRVSIDKDAQVTSLLLSGGPDGVRIGLVGYAGEEGIRPGFVPVRPSSANGDYTLTASVKDTQGNLSTHAASFTYAPRAASLEGGGDLRIADIGVPMKGPGGEWPLRTTPLTRWWSGGAPIRGHHDVSVFLSPDARGSLHVGSLVLGPGERGVIAAYDFDAARQRIALPVAPVATSATDGVFGTLMIRTDLEDVPAIAVAVRLFGAGAGLEGVELDQDEGGEGADEVRVGARVLDHGTCGGGVALVQGTQDASLQAPGSVRCALRWETFPSWLAIDAGTGRLSGRPRHADDDGAVVYQPGFWVAQEQAAARFEPSGAPRTLQLRPRAASRYLTRLIPASADAVNRPWAALSGWLWDAWGESALVAETLGMRAGQEIVVEPDDGVRLLSTSPSMRSGVARLGVLVERREEGSSACQRALIRDAVEGLDAAGPELCLVDREELDVLAVDAATFDEATGETRLTGIVGTALDGGATFRPAEDSAWSIAVSAIGVTGEATPPAVMTETRPDGQWSIGLGRLGLGGARLRVVASARDIGPGTPCDTLSVELPPVPENGAAIAARVHVEALEGARGRRGRLSLVLEDRNRAGDIGAIRWERSADEGGTWAALEGERFPTLAVDAGIGGAGAARYRVHLRNAHSGVESVSEAVALSAILAEETGLNGPTDVPVDALATFTRDVPSAPQSAALWTAWHPESGVATTHEGFDRATLRLDHAGDWVVGVASSVDEGGAVRVIRALDEAVARLQIEGPERAEIGRVVRYLASGGEPGRQAWTMRWRLPDGTLQEGPAVDYAPREGDGALVLEAARSADANPVTLPVTPQLWTYDWPTFSLASKDAAGSEGRVRHYAVTTRELSKTGTEPLQYAWELPEGAVAQGGGELQTVTFAPGVHPRVRVTVSDTRGHATVLVDAAPEPVDALAADISIVTADGLARAPTQALVSWQAQGLQKGERVSSARVWVNGALAGTSASDQYDIRLEKPGLRQIDVEIMTDRGRTARASGMVEVFDGPAPRCRVKVAGDWKNHLDAVADCTVARGEMRGYQWSVEYADDGSVRDFGLRDGRLSLEAAHLARGVNEIRLIGYDDRGVASGEATRSRRDAARGP